MSTLVPTDESESPISGTDLAGYFAGHAKPKGEHRYGLECEIFGLNAATGRPIPYFGKEGVEGVLDHLAHAYGWKRVEEHGRVIALERTGHYITLEPGGQVELSAAPVKTLSEIDRQIRNFHEELRAAGKALGMVWLSTGTQPFATASAMPWVPKARYQIMRDFLSTKGPRAHDMMQRTATNQFNVDFENEADAMTKLRVIYRIAPFAITSFAHSPLFNGRLTGRKSFRMFIWQGTDPARTGLIPFLLRDGPASFEDYVHYLLDTPAFFIVRAGQWIPLDGMTFRAFLEKGCRGHRATWADFRLHLTTVFPEGRLGSHIEIRGMDAQAPAFVVTVCAFWKGILAAPAAALDVVKEFSAEDLEDYYHTLPRHGLSVRVGKRRAGQVARALFDAALGGLRRSSEPDDRNFLMPFVERYVEKERTPADDLIEHWKPVRKEVFPSSLRALLL